MYNCDMHKLSPKTLLVVKNRAMGDSIIGLSCLQYLRDILPQTRIIYAVPKWIKPLYDQVDVAADEVIALDLSSMGKWLQHWRDFRRLEIDTVFEMFQSGRTAKFFKTWQTMGGPTYVAHNHHHPGPVHDQGVIKPNIQRDLDGAWTYFGHSNLPPSYLNYSPLIKHTEAKQDAVILGVVATRETKMWPLEYYKELIQLLLNKVEKVLIPLGPSDNVIEDFFKPLVSDRCQIVKEKLSTLPSKLTGAKFYVGNDTGLKHLCVALDIPTYTLFGPEPPLEWHPYDEAKHPYYFKTPLECRTRSAHYCGLSTCDSMICLNEMTALKLYSTLEELF